MKTIKLHEATKKFKISNKLAMFFLEKMNLGLKSHSSVISMDQLELLRELAENPKKYAALVAEFEAPAKKVKTPEKKPLPKKETAKREVEKKRVEEKAELKKGEPKKEEVKKVMVRPAVQKKEKPPAKKVEVKEKKVVPVEVTVAVETKKFEKRAEPKVEVHPPVKEVKVELRKEERRPERREEKPRVMAVPPRKVEPPPVKKIPVQEKVKIAKPLPVLEVPESIQISDFTTVKELAEKMNIKLRYLEDRMNALQMDYQTNLVIDRGDVQRLCDDLHVKVEMIPFEDYVFSQNVEMIHAQLTSRNPVVTVMGHVDHGKTTLLDTLRKTTVAEKETGGITQKIGAYKLKTKEGDFVFIDTPGHEAFTNLRARGAKVTDIVILVVAANDGVQPQTVEAINHARAANVPIIVAINKIDLAGANTDKVKQELNKNDILVEEWGGKVVAVEISAKLNKNLDTLLEMIHLVSAMQELKAYAEIPARGTVIEARLDSQLGPVATVLVQHGKLQRGDHFICGDSVGKIKSMFDDQGATLNVAGISDPVEIMGFEEVPEAGDIFQVITDFEKAKKVIDLRKISQKESHSRDVRAEKKLSLENLFQMLEQNKIAVFPVIVKTDSFGSGEVVEQLLLKQSQEKLRVEMVYKGIGNITEGDVLLAATSNAIILGFNVKAPQQALTLAKREKVELKLYSVIYNLIEDIEKAVQGKIAPEYKDIRIGKAEVLQKFKISKIGVVAGCMILEGKVTNKSKIKVLRGSDLVFFGDIENLKRIKDEVAEVRAGTECGIRIRNFNDVEPGDVLEIFESVQQS